MFRRSTKAALLVDFDNVMDLIGGAARIESWVAWLEDGVFDPSGRRRRLVEKRVYWNSPFEKHRDAFERCGFIAEACPSLVHNKKSAADMVIALDAIELAGQSKDIDEFIVLTTDSDFVPLVDRLSERERSTVIVANIGSGPIYSVYQARADLAIPSHKLAEARDYQRPERKGLFAFLRRERAPEAPAAPPVAGGASQAQQRRQAAAAIVEEGLKTEGADLSRRSVNRLVARSLGLPTSDPQQVGLVFHKLGYRSYEAMILGLANLDPRIRYRRAGGGLHVRVTR